MSLPASPLTIHPTPTSPIPGSRGRTLHLIDIENLVRGEVCPNQVHQAWSAYKRVVGIPAGDQVRVACSAGRTARCVAFNVPGKLQLLVGGRGKNAADYALIDSVDIAFTARRFAAVIIGSADHIFAPMAAQLGAAGCEVTAVHASACATALVLATTAQVRLICRQNGR